ncbi:MAG: hypothetical protein GEU26_06615 [Nitrososphaeraceae archaeon]|nr:hypothetical protein [Nitrososphaeraceae archaeon]
MTRVQLRMWDGDEWLLLGIAVESTLLYSTYRYSSSAAGKDSQEALFGSVVSGVPAHAKCSVIITEINRIMSNRQ